MKVYHTYFLLWQWHKKCKSLLFYIFVLCYFLIPLLSAACDEQNYATTFYIEAYGRAIIWAYVRCRAQQHHSPLSL